MEDFTPVITLRGRHFSQHEACLWCRAPFRMLVVRADHTCNVCACWRAGFFFVEARACSRRASATGHFSAWLGEVALFHFDSGLRGFMTRKRTRHETQEPKVLTQRLLTNQQ